MILYCDAVLFSNEVITTGSTPQPEPALKRLIVFKKQDNEEETNWSDKAVKSQNKVKGHQDSQNHKNVELLTCHYNKLPGIVPKSKPPVARHSS